MREGGNLRTTIRESFSSLGVTDSSAILMGNVGGCLQFVLIREGRVASWSK